MADNYDDYDRDELIKALRRRDRKPRFGLYWERDDIEHERAINADFVALDLDESQSIYTALAILGHSSLNVTMRYSHLSPDFLHRLSNLTHWQLMAL